MKKIYILICILALTLVPKVYAENDTGSNIGNEGSQGGTSVTCSNQGCRTWDIVGIRLTIVYQDGSRFNGAKSRDIIEGNSGNYDISGNNYHTTEKYSKVDIYNMYSNNNNWKPVFTNKSKYEVTTTIPSGLRRALQKTRQLSNADTRKFDFSPIEDYFSKIAPNTDDPEVIDDVKLLFEAVSRKNIDDVNENLYMLVEPIVRIIVGYGTGTRNYVGTVTEIAALISTDTTIRTANIKPHAGSYSKLLYIKSGELKGAFKGLNGISADASSFEKIYQTKRGYATGLVWLRTKQASACTFVDDKKTQASYKGSTDLKTNKDKCCDLTAFGNIGMTQQEFENTDWYKNNCVEPDGGDNYCDINNKSHFQNTTSGPGGKNCCIVSAANYGYKNSNSMYKEFGKNTTEIINTITTAIQSKYSSFYNTYCKTPTEDTGCKYIVNTSCTENCDDSTSGYIEDIGKDDNEWECIYDSKKTTDPWNNHYDAHVSYGANGHTYCSIFCNESVNYQYPNQILNVEAGRTITIGNYLYGINWGSVRMNGSKQCRTTEIDLNTFKSDYQAASNRANEMWDQYQYFKQWRIAASNTQTTPYYGCGYDTAQLTEYYYFNNTWYVGGASTSLVDLRSYTLGCTGTTMTNRYNSEKGQYYYTYSSQYSGGTTIQYDIVCTSPGNPAGNYIKAYQNVGFSWKKSDGSTYSSATGRLCTSTRNLTTRTEGGGISTMGYSYSYTNGYLEWNNIPAESTYAWVVQQENYYYNQYIDARNKKTEILSALNNCNDWTNAINYNSFEPQIEVSYDNEEYSVSNSQLVSSLINSSVDKKYCKEKGNCSTNKNQENITNIIANAYDCDTMTDKCVVSIAKYYNNKYATNTYNKTYDYTLNPSLYRYVAKPSNYSSHTIPEGQYIDMGYGNLPVSLSSEGEYDISLKLTTLGNNNKLNKFVKYNNASGIYTNTPYVSKECNTFYGCYYNVYKYIQGYETPTDIGLYVIYRPISLENPFPSVDGDGRKTGSNWCSRNDCSNTNATVSKYITNNRGTSESSIYYNKKPMYTIKLTPADIMEIRKYNKEQSEGYGDFNLECSGGRECISKFIHQTFSKIFTGCGTNNNFKYCDSQDGITR